MNYKKTLFKQVQEGLPSGLKEEMAYVLYDNKNKLQGTLRCLKKEYEINKSSNIRNSIDWIETILKEYYYDTKSFKDRQNELLNRK